MVFQGHLNLQVISPRHIIFKVNNNKGIKVCIRSLCSDSNNVALKMCMYYRYSEFAKYHFLL